jgi:hypothetical protein
MTHSLSAEEILMTEMPVQPPAAIAGISGAELAVMQAAAAGFVASYGGSIASVAGVPGALAALVKPAGPDAAGVVSARRDQYMHSGGKHWMLMVSYAE